MRPPDLWQISTALSTAQFDGSELSTGTSTSRYIHASGFGMRPRGEVRTVFLPLAIMPQVSSGQRIGPTRSTLGGHNAGAVYGGRRSESMNKEALGKVS